MKKIMKQFVTKNKINIIIAVAFGLFVGFSHIRGFGIGISAATNFSSFFVEMASFLPLMFILIGLFDVWFPKEKVEKHIGADSGIRGMIWVILLAMLQAGPLYGAFPVASMLWKKGCSIRNIFVYVGAFSTIKIPMLTFEIGFMGVKFSVLRTLITLPVFIGISFIMERFLKNRHFEVCQPD